MSRDDVLAVAERMANAVNEGDLTLLDELFAEDAVDHDAPTHSATERWRYKDYIEGLRAAFPDLAFVAEHIDATDDDLTIIYTVSGTHQGKFLGIEPTGRRVTARGMQLVRFAEGKIVERWASAVEDALVRQLCEDEQLV